jgi:hypothetical protein
VVWTSAPLPPALQLPPAPDQAAVPDRASRGWVLPRDLERPEPTFRPPRRRWGRRRRG